jgi:hypothetical protein
MTSSQFPSDQDPGLDLTLPEIELNIRSEPVTAKPRKLKMEWSLGPSIKRPDNVLDLMKDALEDPDYSPESAEPYKGLWRWADGRVATPEEVKQELANDFRSMFGTGLEKDLIQAAADEMRAEIDREIMESLKKNLP